VFLLFLKSFRTLVCLQVIILRHLHASLEYILAFRLAKKRSYRSLYFGFIIARSFSFHSAGSTQLWKKLRLSFGRSFSVGGGVRKLGLGVAGTSGGISAGTGP
jgi:hypothetical protein